MIDDFFVKEIEVVIQNQTDTPVYLNCDMTPTGVLLRSGTTYIDSDEFWIIASQSIKEPLEVSFTSTSWGRSCTRHCELHNRTYKLTKVGAACGLNHMRTLNPEGKAKVTVTIKRG